MKPLTILAIATTLSCAESPTEVDHSGVEARLDRLSAQFAAAAEKPDEGITVNSSAFAHPHEDKAHFVGRVYNYGSEDLTGLYPVVTYQDSSGAHIALGEMYRFQSNAEPYLEISSLKAGEDGYWGVFSVLPIDQTLIDFEVEFRQ